ncbi:T-cell-specific surface glycoprotein CD28 homolog isoform X2 [Pristis pectinata]|uniref:T-cell-specific surface glycoprotein CD28 homolog isoform X2 n=1 Tax=Pristis pectinata TaxID=685728 RepID=UPI00223DAE44|nr:T-cell-specific surface glycoprotein CD28 homolog isoform X2 [Pristis pectinata]
MKELFQLATSLICLLTVLKIPARAMKVSQPEKIIVGSHNITLKCKYDITGDREAQTFRVTIYREKPEKGNEVCSASFNHTMELFEMRGALHCKGQPDRGSVSVTFIGMNKSDSDWYFCRVEKLYPLPYTEDTGNGSWIFIKPDVVETKRCAQVTQATLIILTLTGIFLLYSVVITYLHWPLGATACILGMKEAVDMKCELIHNSDEPATATWNGQRWETGPRQGKC